MTPEATELSARARGPEFILLVAAWLTLATMMALLARQNLSVPGLYYDEAIFAGMAKDFVTGHVHGQHMPDHEVVTFLGRPFPVFAQAYLGALKSWMLIPSFSLSPVKSASPSCSSGVSRRASRAGESPCPILAT